MRRIQMPANFTEEQREIIRKRLIAVGSSHWGNCSARRTFIITAGVLKILP